MAIGGIQSGGAKRQGERRPWRVRLHWLIRGTYFLVLVAVAVALLWSGERLFHKLDVPIGVIAVKGQFSHVDQGDVQLLVEPLVRGGVLSLNLAQIREQLELHPWIDQVTVGRQWPSGLVITVVEEVPIARWGDRGFLNNRGEMLEIEDNSGLASLPVLDGAINSERSLMNAYREVAQLLQPSGLKIAALKRDERGAWWLGLDNGLQLVIGRDQVIEKMRRFLMVWELELKSQVGRVAQVDIRYDNGVAVKWLDKTKVIEKKITRTLAVASGLSGQV